MNTALKATSVRDLKDAARAINFVLKNKIKGKAAVAALCDLLEVTARTVREESVGSGDQSCCLCGNEIHGYGHNPSPCRDSGRCCDACNTYVVIPARIDSLYRAEGRAVRG